MAGRLSVGAVLNLRDEMSAKLERARGTAKRFVDQIHSGTGRLDRFTGSVLNAGKSMLLHFGERMSAMVDRFFTKLKFGAAIAGAALGALAVKAVNDAMKFEKTLRDSTALLVGAGASAAQADATFAKFGDGILKLAPQLAKAPQDLADAMYDIVSAGFADADALKVLEAAGKGASAGFTDTKTVVKGLVGTLRAYGFEADQAKRITDVMFQAVNVGQLTFEDFAQNIGDVVGIASIAKIPIEEVGAAIAEMTKRGIVPAEAFTSLNRFILSIIDKTPAVKEAMSNLGLTDKVWGAEALAAHGLSGEIEQLLKVIKPTAEDMKQLQSSSAEVVDAAVARIAGDKIEALSSLFGDVRGLRGALVLAATEGYTFNDAMRDMVGSAGAVDRAFEEQEKTASRAKDRLMAYIDVLKIQLASAFLPQLADAFKKVGEFLRREVLDNPAFQQGTISDKVRIAGTALLQGLGNLGGVAGPALAELADNMWHGMTRWWDDHQDQVKKDLKDFFNWVGEVAIPWAIEAAGKLAAALGPALIASLKGIMASPTGLATLLIGAGLKFGALDVIGKTGGAGAEAAAAGALSAAAGELSLAAAALMQAAGAEGVAAAELGAGGAAGALSKVGTGGLFAAGVIPTIAALTLSAGIVYMAGTIAVNQKDETRGAVDTHNQSIADALAKGDWAGVQKLMADENRKKAGQSGAEDARDRFNQFVNQTGSPNEESSATVKQVVDNNIAQYLRNQDLTSLGSLADTLRSTGVWQELSEGVRDAINKEIGDAQLQLRTTKAKGELLSMLESGQDLSSVFGKDEYERILRLPYDEQKKVIDDVAKSWASDSNKNPNAFVDAVDGLATSLVQSQPQLQTAANTYQQMADQLRTSNPALATFYQTLAGILGTLANWKPPAFGPGVDLSQPSTGPGDMGISPSGIPNALLAPEAPDKIPVKGPHARGGRGTLRKATFLYAGEAGAEDYAFAPRSQGGLSAMMGGAGTSVTVQGPLIGQATIREEADVEKIAMRLAFELEKRSGNTNTGTNGPG